MFVMSSKGILFSDQENRMLAELYAQNQEEYEKKLVTASAISQSTKRSKAELCAIWARDITSACMVATRSSKQIQQRLCDLQKKARKRVLVNKAEIMKTGGGVPEKTKPITEADAVMDSAMEDSTAVQGIEDVYLSKANPDEFSSKHEIFFIALKNHPKQLKTHTRSTKTTAGKAASRWSEAPGKPTGKLPGFVDTVPGEKPPIRDRKPPRKAGKLCG
ncbi:hypothetical protein L596_014835 [Steinernema carpocapsae]|uniref:Uncharacterized protein n=1 Tax=Steinernema carpocapsae TaxID=34508 RepID=A0A4U5NDC0_STECR|nr:hypothetical protein L596_014835 [Steinernema carpocapsae]